MADIFVSYTSKDRDWAFWIGQELEKLGHVAHLDAWEISAGEDIAAWMDERFEKADHILFVISETYLGKPYASWERRSAQWASQTDRRNFALPVRIEDCNLPRLLASSKYCDLFNLDESGARAELTKFLTPAERPTGPIRFPGAAAIEAEPKPPIAFPGQKGPASEHGNTIAAMTISNIPINVPRHFLGRDDDLAAIDTALKRGGGRAAVTALHGLRGVGKTTLAAAYVEKHHKDYRATWWIRAETGATIRADLVGLGVQLDWVAEEAPEDAAVKTVLDRLTREGMDILLVYDNAIGPNDLSQFLPRSAGPIVIITSNAPNWGGLASLVEIEIWPKEVGAEFLIVRTGRATEREAALALSEILGGLPLAHEQAAAYCERIGLPLSGYFKKFEAEPVKFLDNVKDASPEYYNRRTAAKSFLLAIEEAAKWHSAAKMLITYAALLAPEPIPLYFFSEGREKFPEPFASEIGDDGLDEAVAALRSFALIDRESILDERDPLVTTECIRLHRLVREVAAANTEITTKADMLRDLTSAMSQVFPANIFNTPGVWPRARRLDAIAVALMRDDGPLPQEIEVDTSLILDRLANHRMVLAAYGDAMLFFQRALAIDERVLGADHPNTGASLNNLGHLLRMQGDLAGAQHCFTRALAICEKTVGPDHPDTAATLTNLASSLQMQSNVAGALPYHERALAINEKVLGSDHPHTAAILNNLGALLRMQGDLVGARSHYERALAIREKMLGPDHPDTATSLSNLGVLLRTEGDLAAARPFTERALAIRERGLGPTHPETAGSLNNLAALLSEQGDLAGAQSRYERALAILEMVFGVNHSGTAATLSNLGLVLQQQGDLAGARSHFERALAIDEKARGSEHPDTAIDLNNLGNLLREEGEIAKAWAYFKRALAIYEAALGPDHHETKDIAENTATALDELRLTAEAAALRQKYGLTDGSK